MNEQDLILTQKIEKREKFDTILAYVLLAILLGAILLVIYLKFLKKEEVVKQEEYTPNYISLNEISTRLNNSTLANRYLNDSATFNTSVQNNTLNVLYTKEDKNINLNIPMINDELEVSITEDNKEIITDIYKEITNIICMYYGNTESSCRTTINNISSSSPVEGIRFVTGENNNKVYITTTRSIKVSKVYNTVTKVSINETDYILNLDNIKISDIKITTVDNNLTFNYSVERTNDETSNVSVVTKLYNKDGSVINENKHDFNENNPLTTSELEITFVLTETLKIEDITNYSIEIIK